MAAALYARRGGVEVRDSIVSGNLVDGSGGAIGSTGDILVVNSHVDGNTTDGDGGALYTDEDGDVTVINSTVDGKRRRRAGGAIFTLEGDVTIVDSTLPTATAPMTGEVPSPARPTSRSSARRLHRNAAVAHVGGVVWARSDLFVSNSTISNNYAEGEGGGLFAAGELGLVDSTVVDNVAPVAASIGGGEGLRSFGSIIGPPNIEPFGGQVQPTKTNCRVSSTLSRGYNFASDASCGLDQPSDVMDGLSDAGRPQRQRGHRRDSNAGAWKSGPRSSSTSAVSPAALGLFARGRAASRTIRNRSGWADSSRSALHLPSAGRASSRFRRTWRGERRRPGPTVKLSVPRVADVPVSRARSSSVPQRRGGHGSRGSGQSARSRLEIKLASIARALKPMTKSTHRFHRWMKCVSRVPISEFGDPDHRSGYAYDEKNGTGLDQRPALAVDKGRGRPGYLFLRFSRRKGCDSAPTVQGALPTRRKRTAWERQRPSLGALSTSLRCSSEGPTTSSTQPSASTSGVLPLLGPGHGVRGP